MALSSRIKTTPGAAHLGHAPRTGGTTTIYATFARFRALGAPQLVAYGSKARESLGYNAIGQLNSHIVTSVGGAALLNADIHWNAPNLIDSIADQLDTSKSKAFMYDLVGRLKTASSVYRTRTVGYDTAGNITLKDGISYTCKGYRIQNGTQNGEIVVRLAYDANGNISIITRQGTTASYAYDNERQLIKAGSATFTYDHAGSA
jgi:YD repeat-containing protein